MPRQAADDQAATSSGHTDSTKSHGNSANPNVVQHPALPATTDENQKVPPDHHGNEEKPVRVGELPPLNIPTDTWAKASVLLSGALVIVGGLGVYFGVRTLRAIEGQVKEMKAQREVMDGQLVAMQGQLAQMVASGAQTDRLIAQASVQATETEKTAAAAKASADAARESIETIISKERARVQIIAGNVALEAGTFVGVVCYLKNVGPTMAFIEDGGIALVKGPKELTPDYGKCTKLPFTGSVAGNSRTETETVAFLQPDGFVTQDILVEFNTSRYFVHCYGFVKYTDLWSRPHEVKLHLRWHKRFGGILENEITQYWEPVGPPEENKDK
jgi:hypothetical protein